MTAIPLDQSVERPKKGRRPQFRPNLPFLGSVGLIAVAIIVALSLDHAPLKPIAWATTLYGSAFFIALLALRGATRRGRIGSHLVAIAAATTLGILVPAWIDPSRYSLLAGGFPIIGTALDELFLFLRTLLVEPFNAFGGLLAEPDMAFWEFLNALALIVWCLVAWGVSYAGKNVKKINADEESAPAYLWPTLNNPTVARTLGYAAILMTAAMLAWGALNVTQAPNSAWVGLAAGFPWFATVAAVYHLCLLAQRQIAPSLAALPEADDVEAKETKSVHPLFTGLRSAYAKYLAYVDDSKASRRPRGQPAMHDSDDMATAREEALKLLSDCGQVLQYGTADKEFYLLFSQAVQEAQDQGRNTLVICPNESGREVMEALARVTRFFSPEINQRWCSLTRADHNFSGRKLYDLILVEEDQFHNILVPSKQEFHHSLRRTRLIVLIDFHAIDACRLYLGLTRLEDLLDLQKESVLCLSRRRLGFEEQIKSLFDRGEEISAVREYSIGPSKRPTYWIAWNDSAELRGEFVSEEHKFRPPFMYDTSAYLSLVGGGEPFAGAVLFSDKLNIPDDCDRLRDDLNNDGENRLAARVQSTERLVHFAPRLNTRISIVQDDGNLSEVLSARYDFYRTPTDRLVHIVCKPRPAHEFAVDWLKADADSFRAEALPYAQKPGIGLTELVVRVESALQAAGGLEQAELRKVLSQASGDLPKELGLNETRGGLLRLFRTINPDLPQAAISARTNADQTHVFSLDATARVSAPSQPSDVFQESAKSRIAQLSRRDEGLTLARNCVISLNRGLYSIERFEDEIRRIVVSPAGDQNGRRTQNLFRRTYTLHLGQGVAREQERAELPVMRMHVHASFTRYSDRNLSWPIDEPLLARGAHVPTGHVHITQRRSYRSIYVVALGNQDLSASEQYSPVLRRTLAASLQDVLGFVFPALAERIAVVDLCGEWAAENGTPHDRLQLRYPIGRIDGISIEETIRLVFRRAGYGSSFSNLQDGWCAAALAVIEDADHDIGVARRVQDSWQYLVEIWKRYLGWAAEGHAPWQMEDGWFDASAAAKLPIFPRV